jgi:hypothetical protein
VYYGVTVTRYMLTGARPKGWRWHDTISSNLPDNKTIMLSL